MISYRTIGKVFPRNGTKLLSRYKSNARVGIIGNTTCICILYDEMMVMVMS